MILPESALKQHTAIVGKTGSGKTFTAKGIVEPLLEAGRRVCVVDPTSAWWGLRSSSDGTKPGFPVVILGGPHGDAPLPPLSGVACAELVCNNAVQVVFDTIAMTVGERTRWFIDFAGALYRMNRTPLHLIIDEAHNFAPQSKVPDPETGKMLHAANTLASGGRSRGIRLMLITQRPAKLHKDSLTCCDTLIAMRLIAPQDREAVEAWIMGMGDKEKGKRVLDSLAQLARGEGWVWFPEGGLLERRTFPKIRTFDSSKTPEDGAEVRAPKRLAEIDLSSITAAMGEAVKQAEANDPKALRNRIAELEAKLRGSAPGVSRQEMERAIEVAFKDGKSEGRLQGRIAERDAILAQISARSIDDPAPPPKPTTTRVPRLIPHERHVTNEPSEGLDAPQQRILDTVLMLEHRGIDRNRESVARWMDLHPTGGRYGTNLAYLRSAGYLDGLVLTELGRKAAKLIPTGPDAALEALPDESIRQIVRVLMKSSPLSREGLAAELGLHPTGGRYGTNLARLRTMGLIPERGQIVLTEGFFR